MPYAVRVFCPTCHGESADSARPYCLACLCGGHVDINPMSDGSIPPYHPDGSPVVLWVDALLPEWPPETT